MLIPSELVLSILSYCDGSTLATCQQVCRHWQTLIDHYDALVWSPCCERDFQKGLRRRFWSLDFPDPQMVDAAMLSSYAKPSTLWQSLYRITKHWSLGQCTTSFLTNYTLRQQKRRPCVVVGTTQEYNFFTSLSVAQSGHIVRSNPMYKGTTEGRQAMIVHASFDQDPTLSSFYLEDDALHGIVCHYSHPASPWIVTGGLDGTVSLWNEPERCVARTWQGHRGRVLCVSMNDQVVISGGSDSMIRVWDLDDAEQRGSIDISSYLSERHDWFQGVGEIALNGHLIVCAPDTSGPVLIFSLLTGSLVYELKTEPQDVAFTRLCLTPFYLLTKGEINPSNRNQVPIYPNTSSSSTPTVSSSPYSNTTNSGSSSLSSLSSLSSSTSTAISTYALAPPPSLSLTPYQLSRYYNLSSNNMTTFTAARSCIDVWDLQTGKLVYRLVPPLPATTTASITDIRISPNAAHVFACVEIRDNGSRRNELCYWDFSNHHTAAPSIMVLPSMTSSSFGNAWACFY
ncbi:WD40-repeat-containing domain protein [Halteromyces radiatus]|uniref:WD40-repeat-containing domain protein n=1 Tax=Halteromyces radiatus TaxID=101107 RepID=UPI002221289B|nr:WD40-repeat-containing domain protein [Halteromyces radiatus]KAI8096499.1 WD40-repeat-containing domain protein [Halteromyces radiatus]